MSALKKFVSAQGLCHVLEFREKLNFVSQTSFEIEIEISGDKEQVNKLISGFPECHVLQKAAEKTDVDAVPSTRYKDFTTFQSVVRTEQYPKYVCMRVELEQILRTKGWTLIHRQQGEGFKPEWVTHVWERKG